MNKTDIAVAVYDSHGLAEDAVHKLAKAGFDMKTISIIGKDHHTEQHVVGYFNTGDRVKYFGKLGAFWGGMAGKLTTTAQLDKTLDKAARADLERRWLVTDVTTWYPVADEPQRHFGAAAEAVAKKDYRLAATEVRRGASYLRLESARAVGDVKKELDAADAQLEKMASGLERGAVQTEKQMDQVFADADHALALAHRAKAAESWTAKTYDQAGYELKAAAQDLESAAAWTGTEAKTAAAAATSDARALGDKLASGGVWAKDEVAKGFESLGTALNKLGSAIGAKAKAAPLPAGNA